MNVPSHSESEPFTKATFQRTDIKNDLDILLRSIDREEQGTSSLQPFLDKVIADYQSLSRGYNLSEVPEEYIEQTKATLSDQVMNSFEAHKTWHDIGPVILKTGSPYVLEKSDRTMELTDVPPDWHMEATELLWALPYVIPKEYEDIEFLCNGEVYPDIEYMYSFLICLHNPVYVHDQNGEIRNVSEGALVYIAPEYDGLDLSRLEYRTVNKGISRK